MNGLRATPNVNHIEWIAGMVLSISRVRSTMAFTAALWLLALSMHTLLLANAGLCQGLQSDLMGQAIPGEYIVVLSPNDAHRSREDSAVRSVDLSEFEERGDGSAASALASQTLLDQRGVKRLIRLSLDQHDACDRIRLVNPEVTICEPNFLFKAFELPDDPLLECVPGQDVTSCQWGLNLPGGVDIRAIPAWQSSMGSDAAIVAVLDTGIRLDHPDIAANIWTNPHEIPGNGIDDDENGFVDDVHGANMLNGSGDPYDDHVGTHGTHVSGIIAATCGNAVGICGVASDVRILPIKFLNALGFGTTASALAAIDYMNSLKRDEGQNIVVSNNSWGGMPFSSAVRGAIQEAEQLGITFVAAAGNDASNLDVFPSYPASYDLPNIVVVAASTTDGSLASFSNFGLFSTDIAAPGDRIVSLVGDAQFGVKSGTSMAAPHVSGVLALAYAINPILPRFQLQEIVTETASYVAELNGLVGGSAVVNAEGAVVAAFAATPAPTPTVTPTRTPSATPTVTPKPTNSQTPTPTVSVTIGDGTIGNSPEPTKISAPRVEGVIAGEFVVRRRVVQRPGRGRSGRRFSAEALIGGAPFAGTSAELQLRLGSRRCATVRVRVPDAAPLTKTLRGVLPRFFDGNRSLRLFVVFADGVSRLLARARILQLSGSRALRAKDRGLSKPESQLCRQLARRLSVADGPLSLIKH